MKNFQFKDIEFKNMTYNPSKILEGKSVFEVYKELAKYPELKKSPGEGLDNELVMLYIFCLYDKDTPYRLKYPDILKRKVEVAHDCGFKMEKGGVFVSPVEDMLKGVNKIVQRKIVTFVRLYKNFKYAYFVTIENSYYNLMLEVMDGGDTKKIERLKDISKELEETMHELLSEDNNPALKQELLRYIEEERIMLRPEDISLKISKGEKPVNENIML